MQCWYPNVQRCFTIYQRKSKNYVENKNKNKNVSLKKIAKRLKFIKRNVLSLFLKKDTDELFLMSNGRAFHKCRCCHRYGYCAICIQVTRLSFSGPLSLERQNSLTSLHQPIHPLHDLQPLMLSTVVIIFVVNVKEICEQTCCFHNLL